MLHSWLLLLSACLLSDADRATFSDRDGDGFEATEAGGIDCDDGSAAVNPVAAEVCDGIDNDCDGETDSIASTPIIVYLDNDGDGIGGAAVSCEQALANNNQYVLSAGPDCDDGEPEIGLAEQEIACNAMDEDCDGVIAHFTIEAENGVLRYHERDQFFQAFADLRSNEVLSLCEGERYEGPISSFGFGLINSQINGNGATIYQSNTNSQCVAALTITDAGNIGNDAQGVPYGGAIGTSLTLANLHFSGSTCTALYAAGITIDNSQVVLDNVVFEFNQGSYGGGLDAFNSVVKFKNTFFGGNSALRGGAIRMEWSAVVIEGGQFLGNYADIHGGAFDMASSVVQVKGPPTCPTLQSQCDLSKPMFSSNQTAGTQFPPEEAFFLKDTVFFLHNTATIDSNDWISWPQNALDLGDTCSPNGWCFCQQFVAYPGYIGCFQSPPTQDPIF